MFTFNATQFGRRLLRRKATSNDRIPQHHQDLQERGKGRGLYINIAHKARTHRYEMIREHRECVGEKINHAACVDTGCLYVCRHACIDCLRSMHPKETFYDDDATLVHYQYLFRREQYFVRTAASLLGCIQMHQGR